MRPVLPVVIGLLLVLVVGCAPSAATTPPPGSRPPATPTPATSSAPSPDAGTTDISLAIADAPRLEAGTPDAIAGGEAVTAFGLDLYRQVVADDPEANLVVSPTSIALALAMARAGARGVTAEEMDAALRGFGADDNAAWVAGLGAALDARTRIVEDGGGTPREVIVRSGNAPFAQDGFPIEPAYLEALAQRFGGGVRLLDFVRDTEGARHAINGWVGDQTKNRIPELLAQGVLTELTRLVLVNATYLNAPWAMPFNEGATAPAPFTRLDGSSVSVPMMGNTWSVPYAAGTGWQAVDLPYAGGELSMLVIVPDDLASFEADLDPIVLAEVLASLEHTQVELRMPSFGMETKVELVPVLEALGIHDAFDPAAADLTGIHPTADLFVSDVIHQANIDVDERGTEAAAATAVVIGRSSAPMVEVRLTVDHPFLFVLRDVPTGAALFLGRVSEPQPAQSTDPAGG